MENDATVKNTAIIAGKAGGSHVVDGPLTTAAIREGSPSLVLNEIDRRIVRVRPMSTPIDQISRMIGARQASSMVVDYYSVDTKPVQSTITAAPTAVKGSTYSGRPVFLLRTDNDSMFAATDPVGARSARQRRRDETRLISGAIRSGGCGIRKRSESDSAEPRR